MCIEQENRSDGTTIAVPEAIKPVPGVLMHLFMIHPLVFTNQFEVLVNVNLNLYT